MRGNEKELPVEKLQLHVFGHDLVVTGVDWISLEQREFGEQDAGS
jgi:hypothetical protein